MFYNIQSLENTLNWNCKRVKMTMRFHQRISPIFLNSVRRVNALLLRIGTFLPPSNKWWEIKSKFSQRYIPDYFVKEFIQILCLVQILIISIIYQILLKRHLSLKFIENQEWFCNIMYLSNSWLCIAFLEQAFFMKLINR